MTKWYDEPDDPVLYPEPNVDTPARILKVYYRTDRGNDLPLDYILDFNCKQMYRRKFGNEITTSNGIPQV